MNKIKQWLRRWLGVEEDSEKLTKLDEYDRYKDKYFESWCSRLDKRLGKVEDIIGKTIRAGFDHHIKQPSWMVVAWRDEKGRERVHFYEVHKEYISEINRLLMSFKRENVIVDAHPQIHREFKW